MHISSLPGRFGCGAFGQEAYRFADLLAESGFSCWQTLPFGWPDEHGSPYKSISAFAGNPYFIDLVTLMKDGLLTEEELQHAEQKSPWLCEFERLSQERIPLLARAASRVCPELRKTIEQFAQEHLHIDHFCRFMAAKKANQGRKWQEFDPAVQADPEDLFLHRFIQYEFLTQWLKLKQYANEKGIEIIGDIPIYLDIDSSDVWMNPENFQLDEQGSPKAVAGVPPDYFAADGQLWGNPLYDWDAMKKEGYTWWMDRIRWQLTLFDGIRIDHFRALSAYWSVPAGAKTAKEGKWIKGPGIQFVRMLKKIADGKLIIAEDLGDIDDGVRKLLNMSGLPGMRVFQFAFLAEDTPHKPHNYPENCVAYSGTHDNNTLLGFVWEMTQQERAVMMDYIGWPLDFWKDSCPIILKMLLRTPAERVIFPIQDILGYGADTRMNIPGVPENNWAFRLKQEQLDSIDRVYFLRQNRQYGRA